MSSSRSVSFPLSQLPITRSTLNQPDGVVLLFRCPKVRVYFFHEGSVHPERTGTLRLLCIEDPRSVVLDVDLWFSPLVLQTVVHKTEEGHYILRDPDPNISFVGIVFPVGTQPDVIAEFELMLREYATLVSTPMSTLKELSYTVGRISLMAEDLMETVFVSHERGQEAGPSPSYYAPSTTSTPNVIHIQTLDERNHCRSNEATGTLAVKIVDGINAAAELTARGLADGAVKTAELVIAGMRLVKDQLPQSQVTFQPEVKETVIAVKEYSGKAIEVGSEAVGKITETASTMAGYLGGFLHSSATDAIVSVTGTSKEETERNLETVYNVTGTAFLGLHTVCAGVRDAGKILGNSLANGTVEVVNHCYGPEAAEVAQSTASALGNITCLGIMASSLESEKLSAKFSKETGKVVISNATNRYCDAPCNF